MKRLLLFIVLVISIIFSCGFQSIQELERKSGGYTEAELINSGRIGVMKSDGTVFYEGFYIAPNGNYFPLNENALKGEPIPTSIITPAELSGELLPQSTILSESDLTDSEQKTLMDVINSFVNAQIKAGIQTSLDEILKQGLITNELIGADGKTYQIACTPDNYPLMIKAENGWEQLHLRTLAKINNFIFGNLLSSPYSGNMTELDKLTTSEFNLAMLETLSGSNTEPKKGQFTFLNSDGSTNNNSQCEKAVSLGLSNNMVVKGNDLVYGYANFKWAWAQDFKNATRDELIKAMQEHIVTVMKQFRGRVTQWSVANEVLPKKWNPGEWDPYAEIIGDDYVDIAFKTAREADPDAILIYNMNMNEIEGTQRFAITFETLKRLRNEKITLSNGKTVPLVDMLGIQMHLDGSKPPTKDQLLKAFEAYGSTGATLAISEMDVDMTEVNGSDADRFSKQADIYRTVLEACLESGVCKQMNFWGVGDRNNWLEYQQGKPKADATIFYDDLTPKKAYYELLRVMANNLKK